MHEGTQDMGGKKGGWGEMEGGGEVVVQEMSSSIYQSPLLGKTN